MSIYDTLGRYYDAFVKDDAAADAWVEWVESFHPQKRFLELACGSGEITKRLAKMHDLSALDLSASMLACAKEKLDDSVTLIQGDMRDLSSLGTFDAIGCFCDSINYLEDEAELEAFFEEVADHLETDGLFFFDSHSEDRLREFADEYEEAGTFDDGTQVQWVISAEDNTIFQDFAFYFDGQTVVEHHIQRVFALDTICALLEKRFERIDLRGDFEEDNLAVCEKYFFVARKKRMNQNNHTVCLV